MANPQMNNGEYMMRALRAAQQGQQAYNPYEQSLNSLGGFATQSSVPTPGERPAEDVTGLRMLEEFLQRRRSDRDGR